MLSTKKIMRFLYCDDNKYFSYFHRYDTDLAQNGRQQLVSHATHIDSITWDLVMIAC